MLDDTAERGDGRYYTADDTATLANALTSIVTTILSEDTTFTAPTVAVNAFNRTQNLSDLFISVFRPSGRTHWPGNLKKYRIRASDATIIDARNPPSRRSTPPPASSTRTRRASGLPRSTGAIVDVGGAANHRSRLTRAARVYTYLGGNDALTRHQQPR